MPNLNDTLTEIGTHLATFVAGAGGLRILDHILGKKETRADIEESEASADERRAKAARILADATSTLIGPLQKHIEMLEGRLGIPTSPLT